MDMFAHDHDPLLKTFFEDLRSRDNSDRELRTLRLLRRRTQRRQVTDSIYKLCNPTPDFQTLQARETFFAQRENRDEILKRYLQSREQYENPEQITVNEGDADEFESDNSVAET